jgi:hypothetical protein
MQAIFHRDGGARRNLLYVAGTAQRHKTWYCRRRSSWYEGAGLCHSCRAMIPLCVVFCVDINRLRAPVVLFARYIVTSLENQDSFPGRRQMVRQRPAPSAAPDDDYVVAILRQDANPPLAPQKMQRLSLLW